MIISVGYGWDDVYIQKSITMRFICDHWSVAETVLREQGGYTMEKAQKVKDAASFGDAIGFDDAIADFVSDSGIYGVLGVIAKIIETETGVKTKFVELWLGETCLKAIFFPYFVAPWNLTSVEKNLSEQDLFEIYRRYMDELDCHDVSPGPIFLEM